MQSWFWTWEVTLDPRGGETLVCNPLVNLQNQCAVLVVFLNSLSLLRTWSTEPSVRKVDRAVKQVCWQSQFSCSGTLPREPKAAPAKDGTKVHGVWENEHPIGTSDGIERGVSRSRGRANWSRDENQEAEEERQTMLRESVAANFVTTCSTLRKRILPMSGNCYQMKRKECAIFNPRQPKLVFKWPSNFSQEILKWRKWWWIWSITTQD